MKPNRADLAIFVLASAAIFYTCSITQVDMDILGKIRFGQDVLQSHTALLPDTYSYLQSNSYWVNDEWLSDAIFGSVWNIGGWLGLVIFKTTIALLLQLILFNFVRKSGIDRNALAMTMLIAVFMMSPALHVVRPLIFTNLGIAAVLILLIKSRSNSRVLIALPPLFMLWTNLHPGFVAGLLTVTIWCVIDLILSKKAPALHRGVSTKWLVLALIASYAATICNPYGIALLAKLALVQNYSRPEIWEFLPIAIKDPFGLCYFLTVALTFFAIIISRRPRDFTALLVWAAFAVLPLFAMRHLCLYAIATLILTNEHLADLWSRRANSTGEEPELHQTIMLVTSSLLGVVIVGYAMTKMAKAEFVDSLKMPVKIVSLLKSADVKGNIATEFDWGEYIIFHGGHKFKVSYDGRRETLYTQLSILINTCFRDGIAVWDTLLDKCATDLVLIDKERADFNLMKTRADYRLLYEDDTAALFGKKSDSRGDIILDYLRTHGDELTKLSHQDPVFLGDRH